MKDQKRVMPYPTRLPQEVREILEHAAKDRGWSLNAWINYAVNNQLVREGRMKEKAA